MDDQLCRAVGQDSLICSPLRLDLDTKYFCGILCFWNVCTKPEANKRAFLHDFVIFYIGIMRLKRLANTLISPPPPSPRIITTYHYDHHDDGDYHHHHRHHVVCLTTGQKPLSKRALRRVQSSAASFSFWYLLFSLISSSSCLRLLPRLPIPSIFPSITCFRRQFLHKMRPIQLAFLH